MEVRGSRRFILLGDVVADQRLEVVLRIKFGYGEIGREIGILVGAGDREGALLSAGATPVGVGWEYADDRTNDKQERDRSVDRVVAGLFAARARQGAVALNKLGDFQEAIREVREVASKIAGYAGSDPELRAMVAELRAEESRWAAPMPAMALKEAYAASNYSMRSRRPDGRASR
jgi:hypothetical protein